MEMRKLGKFEEKIGEGGGGVGVERFLSDEGRPTAIFCRSEPGQEEGEPPTVRA